MKKIIDWLKNHGLEYEYKSKTHKSDEYISIFIERDCIWINGFNHPMKYDKKITIHHNKYSGYGVYEQYGYSLTKQLLSCKKYELVLETIKERFMIKD